VLLLPVAFKLTVSFNRSERILSGDALHAIVLQLYSFDRPTGIDENWRTTVAAPRHLPRESGLNGGLFRGVFLRNFFVIPPALLPGETANADPFCSYCSSVLPLL